MTWSFISTLTVVWHLMNLKLSFVMNYFVTKGTQHSREVL